MRISDWSSDVCSSDLRPVDALLANAGRGLGHGFLDQDLDKAKQVVNLNIVGTISLIHKVGRQMRQRGQGKILITGSIAGFIPGSFPAVSNGTKAFVDRFRRPEERRVGKEGCSTGKS